MKFGFAIVALIVIFHSCSPSIKVYSDFDKSVDISDYRYYYWLSEPEIEAKGLNPLFYNELNDKRIKNAVNKQMEARGYIVRDSSQPLQMHYHIIIQDKTMVTKEPSGTIFGPYWLDKQVNVYPYQEGTLIIDLMESKTKNLAWRGWATGVIESEITSDPQAAINNAVGQIFKKFPYDFH